MDIQRASSRVALAIAVPFALMACWVLVLDNLDVKVFLNKATPLGDVLGWVSFVTSEVAGFWFVADPAIWRTLAPAERRKVVGFGILYFPIMFLLMMYWSLIVAGRVYRVSI